MKTNKAIESARMNPKAPKVLDAITDVVLRYRPKPKSEPAKERRRKKRRVEREKEKHGSS